MEKETKIVVGIVGIFLAFLFTILFLPFKIITAGERGVVLRLGAVNRVMSEGLSWKVPWIESVVEVDIRVQKEQVEASAASEDLQDVHSVIALNFHLAPEKVGEVYRDVGPKYKERLIDPALQETVKAITARFTAEELITKRETVREDIKGLLTTRLEPRGILIDELNIVEFNFSTVFNQAIEAKVTAEQQALAAKNKLEQVKFEAQQRIEEAKGKAQAISIEAEALRSNPQVLEIRAIEKWNGVLPQVTGGAIPFINIK